MFKKQLPVLLCILLILTAIPAFASAPDIGEKPVLKALVETGVLANDPCTGPNYEDIVKATGYQLKMDIFDADQGETKINLALASGEDYDFIRGYSTTMLFNFIENGALANLKEAIDTYGQTLKSSFSEAVWNELTMPDGGIYAIPNTGMPRLWNGLVVRQDWLDALGLEAPKTTDEVIEVLTAFKEKDPGNVGAERIIPFSTSMFGTRIDDDPFLSAFGITYPWNERDGQLVHRVELSEYRDYVAFYRTLYENGLLDVDIAVNKDSTLMEKMNKGTVGMARYPWNLAYQTRDVWAAENPSYQISFFPNPKGPEGAQGMQVEGGVGTRIIVPATSKNAAHVVNYANEFINHYEFLMIGEEGDTWEMKNGVRVPILPTFNEKRGDTFWYQPTSIGDIEYPLWLMRVYKLESMGQAYSDLMEADTALTAANPVGTALNLPVTQANTASLGQLELETVLKIIVGEQPLEALDAMIANWKANGGDASTAEVNAWYANK